MNYDPIVTSFGSGEVSPLMYGRVDLQKYPISVRKSQNFWHYPQGAVRRRSGTRFVAEVKDSSKAVRIERFVFSKVQSYIFEIGEYYIRIYKDEGQVTYTPQNILGITKAATAVLTYDGADYTNGDKVTIVGVAGMTEVNNREFLVANVNAAANTLELSGVNSTGYGAWTSGGTIAKIVEITTPYAEADLFELQFTQDADNLFIFHNEYAPRQITRTSHTAWTITTLDADNFWDGPYMAENTTATTLTPSGTTGSITIDASSTTGINDGSGFLASDVGRWIRIKHTNWDVVIITAVNTTTQVVATVVSTAVASASATWKLSAWCDYNGWPCCGTFYDQRFVLAGSTKFPLTFWMSWSGIGSFLDFQGALIDGTVAANYAITHQLVSEEVNAIRWILGQRTLLIGTSDSEWSVMASTINSPLTPTDIQAKSQTANGSALLPCLKVKDSMLYVKDSRRGVHDLYYDFANDKYESNDISFLAEHLFIEGEYIKDVAYQKDPNSIFLAVMNSGMMATCTFVKKQEMIAWARTVLGGVFGTGEAVIESADTIKTPDGRTDQIWICAKRTINGATKRYIEFFEQDFTSENIKTEMEFGDSMLTYSGAAKTTISSLNHLIGQTVGVCADGIDIGDKTVSASGTITLTNAASTVVVGLRYKSKLHTLRIEGGNPSGSAQAKKGRIKSVAVRLENSLYFKYGISETDTSLYTEDFSTGALFSGDKSVIVGSTFDTDRSLYIETDKMYPLTITALALEMEVNP